MTLAATGPSRSTSALMGDSLVDALASWDAASIVEGSESRISNDLIIYLINHHAYKHYF